MILWLIGFFFTVGIIDEKEVPQSFVGTIFIILFWPYLLGTHFKKSKKGKK